MITLVRGAALALAAATTLTGCGLSSGDDGRPPTPEEAVRITPAHRSAGVTPGDRLAVRAGEGRLLAVRVVGGTGGEKHRVPGRISPDGSTWTPDARTAEDRGTEVRARNGLAPSARYTVVAEADTGEGRRVTRRSAFTTADFARTFTASVTPGERIVTGTGMIVSVEFSHPVPARHRAAVERAVRVRAKPSVPVAGHWFGDRRVDFRPEKYWRPGTKVRIALRLADVPVGGGRYGHQHETYGFTVGRSRRSVVDADRHTLTVLRKGERPVTLPVTVGALESPTYNGRMVITEKLETTRMDSRTVGFGDAYDIPDVPHAMRLTSSGTFVHGNYWAPSSTFGRSNVSHGCVGLRDVRGGSGDTPAGWFFRRSLIGDVVEVTGSDDRIVAPDNGLGGWNMDWADWRAGTAHAPDRK